MMGMRVGCDVLRGSRMLDQMMRTSHLQYKLRHLFPTRSLCRTASARKTWELADDAGPDLIDIEEGTRSHHEPQNRYRDRHRHRDERYRRRDDDQYRRNPGYNFGLEGKAKYGWRHEPRVKPAGEFLFGQHPVLLALQHGKRAVHKLHVLNRMRNAQDRKCGSRALQEIVRTAEQREIPIEWCSKAELSYMSFQRQHQGVVLDASRLSYSCEPSGEEPCDETSDNKRSISPRLWLVLSSVQDPMNMGAILRSAYYLGTEKIVAYNSCHLSPVVSKASAGAMEVFDIHETNDLPKFVSKQKEQGKYVFGSVGKTANSSGSPPEGDTENGGRSPEDDTESGGSPPEGDTESSGMRLTPVTDAVLSSDSLLLIGNEGVGLTEDLVQLCDQLITIPEVEHTSGGNIDCLNVSVATAIMQYHLLSSRKLR